MTVTTFPYRIQIEHKWGDQRWLNTWTGWCAGNDAAEQLAGYLLDFHQQIHGEQILIMRARISTKVEDGRNFKPIAYNQFGARDVSTWLPKGLTMNVLLGSDDWGDPMRKYFHLGFDRLHCSDGQIVASVQSTVNSAWAALELLMDPEFYIAPGAPGFAPEISIEPDMGWHQFKRKWAKKTPS